MIAIHAAVWIVAALIANALACNMVAAIGGIS